jgi:beta-galactosidase
MRLTVSVATLLLALGTRSPGIWLPDTSRLGAWHPVNLKSDLQKSEISSSEFFAVGVWYGGGKARAPMLVIDPAPERDAWRGDLETIRRLGFNSVKSWVDWSSTEPTRGAYRLDALDQLLTLADEAGLRVIVQLYTDAAPEWVGRAHPDASFVTESGVRIGSQASPGFCLDHPEVRKAVSTWIAAVSARARRHSSFYAFDVWSEPHVVNWVWFNQPVQFCYCPSTQARFRDWLRGRYGSIAALNRAWYRTFADWTEVEPPRYGTILSYTDFIDWKTFIAAKLRDDLQMKADAARASDNRSPASGTRPPIVSSHSDVPAVLLSPLSGFGNPDDWWMTQAVDHYGTSIYPKHASSAAPWSPVRLMSGLDGIRSAARERGWWIGELQAGQGATGVRVAGPVTAADLRFWGWAVISRGARAISYYAWYPMSTGYEANGYGMIELDGAVTDRARAAGAFASVVGANARLFRAAVPQRADVAILYNRLSYLAGGDTVGPGQTVRGSMMGLYRALFERNVPVDFIHADEIAGGFATRYKAVFLGYPVMLSRPVADALREYVREGGTLISEARPAWNDERGVANERIPGGGLDEVFGAREALVDAPSPIVMRMGSDLPPALSSLAGRDVPGLVFAEHFAPAAGARVLATWTSGTSLPPSREASADRRSLGVGGQARPAPAIVSNTFGKGQAILVGSFISAAYDQDPDKNAAAGDLLRALVDLAGVTPLVRIGDAPAGLVEARLLEAGHALVLIALNHDTAPHEASITLPAGYPLAEWVNLETGGIAYFDRVPGGVRLRHRFAPRDALVLLIRRDIQ